MTRLVAASTNRSAPSACPLKIRLPSEETAIASTGAGPTTTRLRLVDRLQIFMPSVSAAATSRPSAENVAAWIGGPLESKVARSCPSWTLQTLTKPLLSPEHAIWPVGDRHIVEIGARWGLTGDNLRPVA